MFINTVIPAIFWNDLSKACKLFLSVVIFVLLAGLSLIVEKKLSKSMYWYETYISFLVLKSSFKVSVKINSHC